MNVQRCDLRSVKAAEVMQCDSHTCKVVQSDVNGIGDVSEVSEMRIGVSLTVGYSYSPKATSILTTQYSIQISFLK
jgi:rRNA maturation endonuclease Nob1